MIDDKIKEVSSLAKQLEVVEECLDKHKGQDIVTIDLAGRTSIADYMVVCSGTGGRHVSALASYLGEALKKEGLQNIRVSGLSQADWVLLDAGDIIVHLFRPEVRQFYNLEKMWTAELESVETEVVGH